MVLTATPTITPCHANNVKSNTGWVLDSGDKGLDCDDGITEAGLCGQHNGGIYRRMPYPFRNADNIREVRRGWAPREAVNGRYGH